jgi:hypothetical protein
MSLKNVDFDHVFRRLADKRIEDAMAEGKFDNLPGAGQPLDLEPMPADENARMTWWALRIMRNNDFIPDEVRWRKTVDNLRGEIWRLTDETRLSRLVAQVNVIVHKINTLGTNAMKAGMVPLDLETERERLRERLRAAG